jgi:hypothetical protein
VPNFFFLITNHGTTVPNVFFPFYKSWYHSANFFLFNKSWYHSAKVFFPFYKSRYHSAKSFFRFYKSWYHSAKRFFSLFTNHGTTVPKLFFPFCKSWYHSAKSEDNRPIRVVWVKEDLHSEFSDGFSIFSSDSLPKI